MNVKDSLLCVDRISGYTLVNNPKKWEEIFYDKNKLEFPRHFGPVTGEEIYIKSKGGSKKTEWPIPYKYWKIKRTIFVDHVGGEKFYLHIDGCPAKLIDKGENLQTLSVKRFTEELNDLAEFLCLPLSSIQMGPAEPSVTIYPAFEVNLKDDFISHRGKDFKPYYKDNTGIFMGVLANSAHYETHVYLVNVKYEGMGVVAIRIERKYNRSQTFRRDTGINTFADLITDAGIKALAAIVQLTLSSIVIIDITLSPSRHLTKEINDAIREGHDAAFWKQKHIELGSKQYQKLLTAYRTVSLQDGNGLYHKILEMIPGQNKALTENKALIKNEKHAEKEQCYILLKGNNIPKVNKGQDLKEDYVISNNQPERVCKSCNRDISMQREGSLFCSEKFTNKKQARQCRNRSSNVIHNKPKKLSPASDQSEIPKEALHKLMANPNRLVSIKGRLRAAGTIK